MRCAVSFVTVTVLSIAVGAIAVYIIVITGKVEDCVAGYYCEVENVSTCVKSCNRIEECDDGSDEAQVYCNDLTTTFTLLASVVKCTSLNLTARYIQEEYEMRRKEVNSSSLPMEEFEEIEDIPMLPKNDSRFDLEEKPEECMFIKVKIKNVTHSRGVSCDGTLMNFTWQSGIPWKEIDPFARIISIVNGTLNTSLLHGQDMFDEPRKYPLLDKFYLEDNYIESLGDEALCHMDNLCWLILRGNSIGELSPTAFCSMEELILLKLTDNKLTLNGFQFKGMPKLELLYLDHNAIEEIGSSLFSELRSLRMLNISHNRIKVIHKNAFKYNDKLIEIDLTGNKLTTLDPSLFHSQHNLTKLYMSNNPNLYIPSALFIPLMGLVSLNVESYDISQLDVQAFRHTPILDIVYFKKFSYCKYVPKARRCHPPSDGLSSATNLLIGQSRIAVWCVGLITLLGNVCVLVNRWRRKRNRSGRSEVTKILNIFVTNLAVADFLMGVYLLILAVKDVQFRGVYHKESFNWATSWFCSLTGIIAMISSEVSLLTLTLMSLERFLTIGVPFFPQGNLSTNLARASMLIIWMFATTLALAPAVQWHTEQTLFYGSTGLCFPIHLDDQYPLGWQYTTFVFIGVNSACLLLITVAYSLLFRVVQVTQNSTPLMVKNIELAWRFFLMVITDVLCWAPIILLKWAVLSGYVLPKEIIGWVVIYILPLNSAVNPILYTFSTNEVRNAMIQQLGRLLENFELNRLIPTSQANGNSGVELEGSPRNWMAGRNSRAHARNDKQNADQPGTPIVTTGTTDDTEVTQSTCPMQKVTSGNQKLIGNRGNFEAKLCREYKMRKMN